MLALFSAELMYIEICLQKFLWLSHAVFTSFSLLLIVVFCFICPSFNVLFSVTTFCVSVLVLDSLLLTRL